MTWRTPPRVGVFGIGLAAYWPQFDGLRERLEGYQRGIEAGLEEMGAEVVSAGLVDSAQAARQAGATLGAARLDLVMLYAATYATSSQVLPVVQAVDDPVSKPDHAAGPAGHDGVMRSDDHRHPTLLAQIEAQPHDLASGDGLDDQATEADI
jgi:hypothetical protein